MSVVFQPANRYVPDHCLTVTICLCRERMFFFYYNRKAGVLMVVRILRGGGNEKQEIRV